MDASAASSAREVLASSVTFSDIWESDSLDLRKESKLVIILFFSRSILSRDDVLGSNLRMAEILELTKLDLS